MSLAFLYAGQGSQHPGMGADLYEAYPVFKEILDSADVDFDLKTVCFTDPDGVLDQTEYTQPCMVAFAAGMTAILYGMGIQPDYAAGLSLGEYSALQAAGVFTPAQAVSLAASCRYLISSVLSHSRRSLYSSASSICRETSLSVRNLVSL